MLYVSMASYQLTTPSNEFLMTDRVNFMAWVRDGENLDFTAVKEDNYIDARNSLSLENESGAQCLNDFAEFVLKNKSGGISTGFENLDKLLDGGLYPGLYVIGANSSLGKTTLVLQIADSIAKSGQGVLIFSLEMSRFELIAKTLSRMSFC